ncbi:MAG TPA: pilin [Candidatus Saccharimonadales bacterium]
MMLTNLITTIKIFADACNSGQTFFGLPVWYKYIKVTNVTVNGVKSCNFSNFVFWPPDNLLLILLAIFDMLLIIGGIVAVIFVIYGGIQFIVSQGEPENIKHARGTIINALIGLAITIVAATLVNFLGNSLGH